jgi:hypothetical protein
VRYEARIVHRLGPFASSALGYTRAVGRPQGTWLTITCREPVPLVHLVHLLDRLGVEIEEIHRRGTGPMA